MRYSEHTILVKEPNVQSLAALVLLTKKLAPKKTMYRCWLKYRAWYLKQHMLLFGNLSCFYCGKQSLKKQSNSNTDLATLDHVKPISKGGDKFNSSNIVIACYSCNQRKRNMPVEMFKKPIV